MVNLHIIYGAELINLQMEYHDKVRDIKEQIKTSTHIPVASQRLSLGNLELEDGRSIRGYSNIHDGTTLHLVFEQGDSPKGKSCLGCFKTKRSSRLFCGDD